MSTFYFGKEVRAFLHTGTGGLWYEIILQSPPSFNQGSQQQGITVDTLPGGGDSSTYHQTHTHSFETSLDPVQFSFQMHLRPYADTGDSNKEKAVEAILWEYFTDGTSHFASTDTTAYTVPSFLHQDPSEYFDLYFVHGHTGGMPGYKISNCVLTSAKLGLGDGTLASISWSGVGTTLTEVTHSTSDMSSIQNAVGTALTNNYITNKLSYVESNGLVTTLDAAEYTQHHAKFGNTVDLKGDTLIVGSYWNDDPEQDWSDDREEPGQPFMYSGATYVYRTDDKGRTWEREAILSVPQDQYPGTTYTYMGNSVYSGEHLLGGGHGWNWEQGKGGNITDKIVNTQATAGSNNRTIILNDVQGLQVGLSVTSVTDSSNLPTGDDPARIASINTDTNTIILDSDILETIGAGDTLRFKSLDSGGVYTYRGVRTSTGRTWESGTFLQSAVSHYKSYFGINLDVSGNWALIGSPGFDFTDAAMGTGSTNRGHVEFWHYDDGWKFKQRFFGNRNIDYYGSTCFMDGRYAIVNRYGNGSQSEAGANIYYLGSDNTWSLQQQITGLQGVHSDYYSNSCAITSEYAVIGAAYNNTKGGTVGAASVYKRSGTSWSLLQTLYPTNPRLGGDLTDETYHFGYCVHLEKEIKAGNVYIYDGNEQAPFVFKRGNTYRFTQEDSSNTGHRLRFSAESDGAHNTNGSQYNVGVTEAGTPGSSGGYTEITVSHEAPDTIYYYCQNHSGMGGVIHIDPADDEPSSTTYAITVARKDVPYPTLMIYGGRGTTYSLGVSPGSNGSGDCHIYKIKNGTFQLVKVIDQPQYSSQQSALPSTGRQDRFGESMSVEGDTIIIAAPYGKSSQTVSADFTWYNKNGSGSPQTTHLSISTFSSNGSANGSRTQGTYTITGATGSISGTGADFSVEVAANGTPTVTMTDSGSFFTEDETITIADSLLGGGGAPDVVLTVTAATKNVLKISRRRVGYPGGEDAFPRNGTRFTLGTTNYFLHQNSTQSGYAAGDMRAIEISTLGNMAYWSDDAGHLLNATELAALVSTHSLAHGGTVTFYSHGEGTVNIYKLSDTALRANGKFPIISASVEFSYPANTIQYPLLGEVDTPISFSRGPLSIGGQLQGYIFEESNVSNSKDFLSSLLGAKNERTDLSFHLGGRDPSTNRVKLHFPNCLLSKPEINVGEISTFSVSFTAESTDIAGDDINKSNAVSIEYKSSSNSTRS